MNRKGGTHLSLIDRNLIFEGLIKNMKLNDIAKLIDKDPRTISKEIKKRRQRDENGKYKLSPDDTECKRIVRFPFVCNGCKRRCGCRRKYKYNYIPSIAQKNYEIILKSSREGIDMELSDKIELDTILKNGVDKGQSPYHIVTSNKDKIKCSLRTVYRYIDKNVTTVQSIDLRRKVRLKPRKKNPKKNKNNLAIRKGREYNDFIRFHANNLNIGVTEIDTVVGPREGENKCLLTIHFTLTHFCIAILLDRKNKKCVTDAFVQLQKILGKELYSKLFFCTLTDRGSEFVDPVAFETFQETGEKVANLFYCNSYCSYQKGAIEENHTLIRYVIPQGTSMNHLDQSKIDLMMSHINSYARCSVSSTPHELETLLNGKEFLDKIRIKKIDPNEVNLKPNLIK